LQKKLPALFPTRPLAAVLQRYRDEGRRSNFCVCL
jgi:hypothetical protein